MQRLSSISLGLLLVLSSIRCSESSSEEISDALAETDTFECTSVTGVALDPSDCSNARVVLDCVHLDDIYAITGDECRIRLANGLTFVRISVPDLIPLAGYSLCPQDTPRHIDCEQ